MNEAAIEREQPATTCHEQHEPMSLIPLHTAQLYGVSGDENSQSETKGGNQPKPIQLSLWSQLCCQSNEPYRRFNERNVEVVLPYIVHSAFACAIHKTHERTCFFPFPLAFFEIFYQTSNIEQRNVYFNLQSPSR